MSDHQEPTAGNDAPTGKRSRCGATFDHDWHSFQGQERRHVCDGVPRFIPPNATEGDAASEAEQVKASSILAATGQIAVSDAAEYARRALVQFDLTETEAGDRVNAEHECVFVEEQEPSGRLILPPCLVCGLAAMDALEQLRDEDAR